MKRVFVLGAGFSKGAGIPLARELTRELVEAIELQHEEEREEVRKLLEPDTTPEVLADVLRGSTDRWWRNEVPRFLAEHLPALVLRYMPVGTPNYVRAFLGELDDTDVIVSFNYDFVVERALESSGRIFDLGFSDNRAPHVALLKLHGSIDWMPVRGEHGGPGTQELFRRPQEESEGPNLLLRLIDPRLLNILNVNLWPLGDGNGALFGLPYIGLGAGKLSDAVPGLERVWKRAEDALRSANEVYVIGYSLPDSDPSVADLIKVVFQERERHLDRLVVVNPSVDAGKFGEVFRTRVEHDPRRAEDIPWPSILGGR